MDISDLCPKDEKVWVTYYNKNEEPLFFLTGPVNASSTMAAQTGAFALYSVNAGAKDHMKAKKLGSSRSPLELETKYNVVERMRA